ncbi:MAG TPA: FUSC family protein [Chthoniobacter sp.]|jgi:uncharacterized membrane protein YccC
MNDRMPKKSPLWLDIALIHFSVRSAVAALLSYFVARAFTLPEAYWATITTLVVTQSAPGTCFSLAARRFLGTALGAVLATLLACFGRSDIWTVAAGIFLLGLISCALGHVHEKAREHFDRTTYRFAGITLAISMLIVRAEPVWVAALHRFLEVSIGIVVALALAVLWPDPWNDTPK